MVTNDVKISDGTSVLNHLSSHIEKLSTSFKFYQTMRSFQLTKKEGSYVSILDTPT